MDNLDLARWQFAITTVYHFLFVPVTIGLSALVAWYHTAWVRRRREDDLRLAKFFGKLFTINFALGLVTGIVQEFQFGMNWSDYSRFVGDIFGAPLAIEALLAFFLESTFLGLWIFGWGRIPEKLHAACMWIVHVGTLLSAYFILAANSFMQNPVGYRFNPETNRAELTDFVAVLTNKVQLVTFPHVVIAAYMVGGAMVMAVSLWHLRRARRRRGRRDVPQGHPARRRRGPRRRPRRGGHRRLQGKIMTEVQPMKMAAAEALYEQLRRQRALQPAHGRVARRLRGEVRRHRPGSAELPRHRPLRRQRQGHQRAQGGVRPEVRHRQPAHRRRDLHAQHPAVLLELPADDRGRPAGRPHRRAHAVDHARGAHPPGALVALGDHGRAAAAHPRQQLRLDLHRGRPPAVAGLRGDGDEAPGSRPRWRPARWSPRWSSTPCSTACSPSSR